MAFLDFNRSKAQPQAEPKPTPQAAKVQPEKASQSLSENELAKAKALGDLINKATAHARGAAAPTEGGSNAALLQKQNNQDKTQAALSPTDRFAGKTALQKPSRGWER